MQSANFTIVAKSPFKLSVMGASVSDPNAKYPQQPKTAMSEVIPKIVFFRRDGNHSLSAHDDSSGNTSPTPSRAYSETLATYKTFA
mmetsp:Transcript_7604/g.9489  ORF Transcript_7604/g.9489 Transcript_7604/m.9489 type:complete len:86 (-) Transcript_7604:306-563(-)